MKRYELRGETEEKRTRDERMDDGSLEQHTVQRSKACACCVKVLNGCDYPLTRVCCVRPCTDADRNIDICISERPSEHERRHKIKQMRTAKRSRSLSSSSSMPRRCSRRSIFSFRYFSPSFLLLFVCRAVSSRTRRNIILLVFICGAKRRGKSGARATIAHLNGANRRW